MLLRLLLLSLFSLSSTLFGSTLKEKFCNGSQGDYIVTEKDKTYTAFIIHTLKENSITLEEISIPAHITSKKLHWRKWLESGAKGNTSWLIYEMDLEKKTISNCYSFTRKTYLSLTDTDSLLMTLLDLPLSKLSDSERKRIGPPPQDGPDNRKIWNPPGWIDGKQINNAHCEVYKTRWPKDKSDLSGKYIELYFNTENADFPFPFWIQISDGSNTFKIRTIDSGRDLTIFREKS